MGRWTEGQGSAIDGKNARRSQPKTSGQEAIHRVRAWASANRLRLGQWTGADKRNEITAIPELLQLLDVQGCSVTMDAIGPPQALATSILDHPADSRLALQGNPPPWLDAVQEWWAWAHQPNWQDIPPRDAEALHTVSGRVEPRRGWASDDPLAFDYIRHAAGWTGFRSLIMLQRQRRLDALPQTELAFSLSSLPADAARLLPAIRDPGSIETTGPGSLQLIFGVDASPVRISRAPLIFARLRRLA